MIEREKAIAKLNSIAQRGTCRKRKVGCFVTIKDQVVIEAANGMPDKAPVTCLEGGCPRCKNSSNFSHGMGYDLCFCLHAEEKAIAYAARYGVALKSGILYTSYQSCIMCIRKIIEVGISGIRYIEPWEIPDAPFCGLQEVYNSLSELLPHGMEML